MSRLSLLQRVVLFAIVVLCACGPVLGAEDGRPKYNPLLRQNEDWSAFAPGEDSEFFDPIKHINLSDDGSIWISLGGSARARWENFANFGFGQPNDDDFLLTRARVHADLHLGDNVRVFAELKSAFSTTRSLPGGQRTLDNDEFDLQQLFADVMFTLGDDTSVTVRPGRQMLTFGKQRLVSPLPWGNAMRTWDGLSVILKTHGWKVHAFWTQFAPVQKYEFNTSDRQTQFYGAYATGTLCETAGIKSDLYFLGLDQSDATNTFNGTTGKERRYTLGGRLWGKVGKTGFDYDVEGAYQFGDIGGADIDAWMLASQFGYKFGDAWKTRVHLGFDYATGDDTAGGDVQTFNQLFPLGHAYLGYIDAIGRQNIIDLSTGIRFSPIKKLTLGADLHFFWREDTSDAVYNAGGGVLRAGALASDDYVGSEVDLTAKYKLDAHTTVSGGYSHFFAGDFVDNATPAANEDIDFFYFQVHYKF